MPLLQQQVQDTSLKGSFGVTRRETEVSPSAEQLVQVGARVHWSVGTEMTAMRRGRSSGRGAAGRVKSVDSGARPPGSGPRS